MPSFPRRVSAVWIQCSSAPFSRFSTILPNKDDEFLVVPYFCKQSMFGDAIYSYNTKHDEWSTFFPFPKEFEATFHSAVFDAVRQLIFVCDKGRLYVFSLKTKTMHILHQDLLTLIKIGARPGMALIGDKLHLIGNEDKHFVLNLDSKSVEKVHEFGKDYSLFLGNLLHFKSEKKLILFDGSRTLIHEFETLNNKWTQKQIKIDRNYHYTQEGFLQDSAIVCSVNQEWIFMLGGRLDDYFWTDSIFVYNVKRNELRQSSIKLPFKSFCRAQVIKNEHRDDLLVTGFVNECFQSVEFSNIQMLPYYLVQFLARWVSNEYIYLLDYFDGEHWKIHIDSFF